MINQPSGNPAAGSVHSQPNIPSNTSGNTPVNGNQVSPQRTPVWTNENIGHTPANTNQGGQKPEEKAVVPARPASPPPAPRAMVPQPPHNPPPPARTTVPVPQHKNAPSPKENNKDKEKDKDKEPKGH